MRDATDQAELVRSGAASPAELVNEAIAAIEATNPELNAVVTPLFDKARAAAAAPDLPEGPFRGVPFLLKDLHCHSEGDPMYEGSRFLKEINWVEREDTVLAARFRAAGFVFCGKTNVPEFGILPTTETEEFGAARNPWNTGHTPGGSSGGSAAAVAAGVVAAAHGNDGGGSIRIPAAHCGLVGLKPSRGRISLGRDMGDVMAGLVNEGVLTRSVRDTASILDAVMGSTPGDPYAAPALPGPLVAELTAEHRPLRIAMRTAPPGRQYETHPDCVEAAQVAARLLESLGHGVDEVELAELDADGVTETFLQRWGAGVAWVLDYWSRRTETTITEDDVEALTEALADLGRGVSAADFLTAVEHHQVLAYKMAAWQEESGYDLILTPTTGEPAPPLGTFATNEEQPLMPIVRATPSAAFTAGMNMTGAPAISLPLHWTAGGLPVGAQLSAPYGREDLLIRVAAQCEEAAPWAGKLPPFTANVREYDL